MWAGIAMAIKKQEFYEGAALHLLARSGRLSSVRYAAPFFLLNNELNVFLKYSTKDHRHFGIALSGEDQLVDRVKASVSKITDALECGADSIAVFGSDANSTIAASRKAAIHNACYRQCGVH